MSAALALILASAPADQPAICSYGTESFLGTWRAETTGDTAENKTSVIEFSRSGLRHTWRQYLHYRQLDQGRWQTSAQCGEIVLRSQTSELVLARFKALDANRIVLERSGQVYKRD